MTVQSLSHKDDIRHNWTHEEITALMDQPFNDLVFTAASMHRKYFDPNEVQVSTLLSIKTGACPEDCKYCSQSAHYNTEIEKEPLIDLDEVIEEARKAKEAGSSRFCMGAAWRQLHDRDVPKVQEMIKTVKDMGMETCVTLGMAKKDQLVKLKEAGLDFYNHNVDTSEEFYGEIITTRNYQDRLDTLQSIADVGLNTCSGGIIGLGESKEDRIGMLQTLANLPTHPKSVPINLLVPIKGTPLADVESVDVFDFVRMIAIARIMMPASYVRLSAGRESLNDEAQALCFLAGANSIFYGEKLLTASNPKENEDMELFSRLNLRTQTPSCRQELKKQQHA